MKKCKAAFFDVDGTLTSSRTWEGIIKYFRMKKEKRIVYARFWVYHWYLYILYKIGVISQFKFRTAWAADLGWFLKGLTIEEGKSVWQWVVKEHVGLNWHEHSVEILKKHQKNGDYIVLVSASPAPMVEQIGQDLGVDMAIGTEFAIEGGRYTGNTDGAVCNGENKESVPKKKLIEAGIEVDFSKSFAYADSTGDIALLEMVGNPVALNPDEVFTPIAKEHGWKIISKE